MNIKDNNVEYYELRNLEDLENCIDYFKDTIEDIDLRLLGYIKGPYKCPCYIEINLKDSHLEHMSLEAIRKNPDYNYWIERSRYIGIVWAPEEYPEEFL